MIPEEGQTVDCKESLGQHREIVETCAAFATAQGGTLYIGVRDDGSVLGVQIGKGTLESTYIEQFGTGIRRMLQDCREAGVPEPEFESRAGAFRTIFPRAVPIQPPWAGLALNERQKRALEHVTAQGRITRPEYERVATTTGRTAKRDLNDLVKKQILSKRGAGNSFWYELVGPQPDPSNPENRDRKSLRARSSSTAANAMARPGDGSSTAAASVICNSSPPATGKGSSRRQEASVVEHGA
jgi:predicted HTH transcriptional regulator